MSINDFGSRIIDNGIIVIGYRTDLFKQEFLSRKDKIDLATKLIEIATNPLKVSQSYVNGSLQKYIDNMVMRSLIIDDINVGLTIHELTKKAHDEISAIAAAFKRHNHGGTLSYCKFKVSAVTSSDLVIRNLSVPNDHEL